jgi:hypothetical protein
MPFPKNWTIISVAGKNKFNEFQGRSKNIMVFLNIFLFVYPFQKRKLILINIGKLDPSENRKRVIVFFLAFSSEFSEIKGIECRVIVGAKIVIFF